jgi:hypothetical protein
MKNFYDLFKLLEKENPEVLKVLLDDFMEDWRSNLKNIHLGKAERKKNLENFVSANNSDVNNFKGLYASPYYILYTEEKTSAQAAKKVDLQKPLKEFFGSEKVPVDMMDYNFYDSLSRAKCLGYKLGSTDYYLNIDGFYYNFSLIHEIFNIIGHTPKNNTYGEGITYNLVFPERDKKHPLLMIITQFGTAFLLPTTIPAKYEISWKTFKEIDSKIDNLYWKIA